MALPEKAFPCSRVIHVASDGRVTLARSMDWKENNRPKWWVFPRGMARTGGTETNALQWTSQHGSIVVSMYDTGAVEGMNEKGLMVQGLYLSESKYGTRDASRPGLSIMAYSQYLLDSFPTVAAAVSALEKEPFQVVTVLLGGEPGTAHWALADSTGDSAIVEYVNGKQIIHHDRKYTVMCNSPTFDQQLAVNAYWNSIGGGRVPARHLALRGPVRPGDLVPEVPARGAQVVARSRRRGAVRAAERLGPPRLLGPDEAEPGSHHLPDHGGLDEPDLLLRVHALPERDLGGAEGVRLLGEEPGPDARRVGPA